MAGTDGLGRLPLGRLQGSREDFGNCSGLRNLAWEAGLRRKVCSCPSLRGGTPQGKDTLGKGVLEPFPDLGELLEARGWGVIAWLLVLLLLPS